MSSAPPALRGRIVSGMRWTLWLSVLTVPFSYGTSVLLARTSPEVIGTYGLLMVYIGVVASLFYFGGDSIIIKFVPELSAERRLSFLASYLLVILAFVVSCLGFTALWPKSLQYLFGDRGGVAFQLLILCLSPLYILFSLVLAAHKAVLEMRWAQMLARVLTVGSFLCYAVLYVGNHNLLETHYTGLIWSVYLGLTALATVIGLKHLVQLPEWRCDWRQLRFFLPPGFWHYTLTTEQVSITAFLIARLDFILIMNLGGLELLGKYVAVVTIADILRTGNRFFCDTLFPSLTNVLASGNDRAGSQVFSMNLRLLFLVNLAGICVLALFIDPILALFGPHYTSLRSMFILMLLFGGLAGPGSIGGILLSSVGKQQRAFWVYLGQLVVFLALFFGLWPKWHLSGVVLATGLSSMASSIAVLFVAKASSHLVFAARRTYAAFVCFGAAAGFAAIYLKPFSLVSGAGIAVAVLGLFLWAGRYRMQECKELLQCFLPGTSA